MNKNVIGELHISYFNEWIYFIISLSLFQIHNMPSHNDGISLLPPSKKKKKIDLS